MWICGGLLRRKRGGEVAEREDEFGGAARELWAEVEGRNGEERQRRWGRKREWCCMCKINGLVTQVLWSGRPAEVRRVEVWWVMPLSPPQQQRARASFVAFSHDSRPHRLQGGGTTLHRWRISAGWCGPAQPAFRPACASWSCPSRTKLPCPSAQTMSSSPLPSRPSGEFGDAALGGGPQRASALSTRISSVLSASYSDLEIRDALETLDARGLKNTQDMRRQLRLDVQRDVIQCNGDIVQDFGRVAEVILPCAYSIWDCALTVSSNCAGWELRSKP